MNVILRTGKLYGFLTTIAPRVNQGVVCTVDPSQEQVLSSGLVSFVPSLAWLSKFLHVNSGILLQVIKLCVVVVTFLHSHGVFDWICMCIPTESYLRT